MAQDAKEASALVATQPNTPNAPAMRHDKPQRAMRVAHSPLPMTLADDIPEQILAIAQGAGVEVEDGATINTVFGGVERLSPFAPARAASFLFSVASGGRHREDSGSVVSGGGTVYNIQINQSREASAPASIDQGGKRTENHVICQNWQELWTFPRCKRGLETPTNGQKTRREDGHGQHRTRHHEGLWGARESRRDRRGRTSMGVPPLPRPDFSAY